MSAEAGAQEAARRLAPGLCVCAALALAAQGVADFETAVLGAGAVGAATWAMGFGLATRAALGEATALAPGAALSARRLMEATVALLGAQVDLGVLLALGPVLLVGAPLVVAATLAGGIAAGALAGVPPRLAALVAIGHAVCGNAAICAAATVLRARPEEVSAAIAVSASIGMAMTLALPLLGAGLALDPASYGALAGLAGYAVPQAIAAAASGGALSVQVATTAKLTRVLLLAPAISAVCWSLQTRASDRRALFAQPWFIWAFLALASLRVAGLIPFELREALGAVTLAAMLPAMAGVGLETDLRALSSGGRGALAAASGALIALVVSAMMVALALAWGAGG